jgi:hypothetical protein
VLIRAVADMLSAWAVWLKGCVFNLLDAVESSFLTIFQSIILRLQDNSNRRCQGELTDITAPSVLLRLGNGTRCWRNTYFTGSDIQVKVAECMPEYC